jgi:hypothetical protein
LELNGIPNKENVQVKQDRVGVLGEKNLRKYYSQRKIEF